MKRSLDIKKLKTAFRVIIIAACVVFIIAWTGSFFATRQHNKTVAFIALNPLETHGVVIENQDVNSSVQGTKYEFLYSDKKYLGEAFENYGLSTGEDICIAFNKDKPWENVYCRENEIIPFNYTIYSIKIVGAFIVLLFFGYLWKFIVGDKRIIAELTSRRK